MKQKEDDNFKLGNTIKNIFLSVLNDFENGLINYVLYMERILTENYNSDLTKVYLLIIIFILDEEDFNKYKQMITKNLSTTVIGDMLEHGQRIKPTLPFYLKTYFKDILNTHVISKSKNFVCVKCTNAFTAQTMGSANKSFIDKKLDAMLSEKDLLFLTEPVKKKAKTVLSGTKLAGEYQNTIEVLKETEQFELSEKKLKEPEEQVQSTSKTELHKEELETIPEIKSSDFKEEHEISKSPPKMIYLTLNAQKKIFHEFGNEIICENKITMNYLNTINNHFAFKLYKIQILEILKSNKDNVIIKNELIKILGENALNYIDELIKKRIYYDVEEFLVYKVEYALYELIINNKLSVETEKCIPKREQKKKILTSAPAVSSQVIVQTEEEKRLAKQLKRKQKTKGDDESKEQELSQIAAELEISTRKPLFKKEVAVIDIAMHYSHVYDERISRASKVNLSGNSIVLPSDIKRYCTNKYEEIVIPARQLKNSENDNLIEISKLDKNLQTVFSNIKYLNRIQTEVFPVAYNTNENMLICAPTGAGKTNIALITIISLLQKYTHLGVLQLNQFKIVYVCPMKALAAEMTSNFSKKLESFGLVVKEITGDTQISKMEMLEAQMLVTTPEKWDIITRKGNVDREVPELVKLIIFDEIHLLNNDRGPVIESLVARTMRQIVTTQSAIRIVGLSATVPNYIDVAKFLKVDLNVGLFYFDSRFRTVPLEQTFIGIRESLTTQVYNHVLDDICFDKVLNFVKNNKQVMVFVHTRKGTMKTAMFLKDIATKKECISYFLSDRSIKKRKIFEKLGSGYEEIIDNGFGVHHAGMTRAQKTEMENLFMAGIIKVLVCTATLAWGVNLPAHGVIIKDTTIYDAKRSTYVDLDVLDVLQIFGRAGRPQFDKSGSAILITKHDKLRHYLLSLTNQIPIESKFLNNLPDNLNAEIVLGTVNNVSDAVQWLSFTYLFIRMKKNPLAYGVNYEDIEDNESLEKERLKYVHEAAKALDKAHMIRFNEYTGEFIVTDLGRTASIYYINFDTVEIFNEMMVPHMTIEDVISMMCHASEFKNIQVCQDELEDLDALTEDYCEFNVPGGSENVHGKVNILMQTYLGRGYIKRFSLQSDAEYIVQNITRIARALFAIAIHRGLSELTQNCLLVCQMFEQRCWPFEMPLKQFNSIPPLIVKRLEESNISVDELKEMNTTQLTTVIKNKQLIPTLKRYIDAFPTINVESLVQPITRNVIRVKLFVKALFKWNSSLHNPNGELFWIWIEDPTNDCIYHCEKCSITKRICMEDDIVELIFTIPIMDPRPVQYLIRTISNTYMGTEKIFTINFKDLHLPDHFAPHTDLLSLQPLSITVLKNPDYESLYKFTHFNPVQTQIFHCLYYTDNNVLLGAPTGSGKTIAAEICVFRLFNTNPSLKVIYIAPLKALVRERVIDWQKRLGSLNKRVVQITGDVGSAVNLTEADVIITTPEKWDGLSRDWRNRSYIRNVGLIVIDEIHLLGEDRGPVLEVIVSRTRFICHATGKPIRIVGLSTALANAGDLATWLGVKEMGLYNFRPSVRTVPLDVHIMGFPGKHYCPRMVSMNKPTYCAIQQYSPNSPALVFCSSRKQTRVTAMDLITFLLTDSEPTMWYHGNQNELNLLIKNIHDNDLKHFLPFGIGIHHAGLQEYDRNVVEQLFVNQIIQVLISTSTLAWGVNFPAHLVVIKGTEYYDALTKKYVDMPVTDILQMMGRAGRPQYDTTGVACVFVQDAKKNFYKKFLYEPFPVESNLLQVLPDHINAEIAAGSVKTKSQFINYLSWTYFYTRLIENPSYYNLIDRSSDELEHYLNNLVDDVIDNLVKCENVILEKDEKGENIYKPTVLGKVACDYYLSYKTMLYLKHNIKRDSNIINLLENLSRVHEYATFPVRHNEDIINKELLQMFKYETELEMNSSHLKVFLLIYGYLENIQMPNQEYVVDTKTVLDQAIRILQAMQELVTNEKWLSCVIKITQIKQMIIQGYWLFNSSLLSLPFVTQHNFKKLEYLLSSVTQQEKINLPLLMSINNNNHLVFHNILTKIFDSEKVKKIETTLKQLPLLSLTLIIKNINENITNEYDIHNNDMVHQLKYGNDYKILLKINRTGTPMLDVKMKKFPKQKEEMWFVVIGQPENDELICIKNIIPRRKYTVVALKIPVSQKGLKKYHLYLMSDCYLGLDQQYTLKLQIE